MEEGLYTRLRSTLGLNDYEVRAYLALLRRGRGKPVDIARWSGVPLGRIYDVLRSLEAKGLVVRVEREYEPLDPRASMARIAARIVDEAERKAREIRALATVLEEAMKAPKPGEHVTLIHGLDEVLALVSTIITACREPPMFTAYKAAIEIRSLWPLLHRLLESIPDGARVLVHDASIVPREMLEKARELGAEVREASQVFIDMMVACDDVVIGLPGPAGTVAAVHVKSRDFADAMKRRLMEIWRASKPTLDSR